MRSILKVSSLLAATCLLSACSIFGSTPYERPNCHPESTDEDCTNFVNDHKLDSGFRDYGFDEAHRKQGYENLRQQRRQRREQSRGQQTQQNPIPEDPLQQPNTSPDSLGADRR